MPKLVLVKPDQPDIPQPLDYNTSVTLATLQNDCKVYCFVFGKSDLSQELNNDLKGLGEEYGKNLFVGHWNMGDDNYQTLSEEYKFQKIPCIIVTSLEDFSNVEDGKYAYVKLDGRLLRDEFVNETKNLIRELYNLFMRGEIRNAVTKAKHEGYKLLLVSIARKLGRFSEKFLRLLGDIGLTIDYAGAKIILGKDSKT